VALLSSI
jgi:hypothetical protein